MVGVTAATLAKQPPEFRQAFLASLTPAERAQLPYNWKFWARPNQVLPPGNWQTLLMLAGRGFGKTRTGAEIVREWAETGQGKRIALVAPTAADARDVMVEGESGILAISRPGFRPRYEPSKRRLTWPNGAIATTYSADKPDRLRGPQHDKAWADELCAWRYPDTWDMLMFGLRLGRNPQAAVTTTPRPIPILRKLLADETTHVVRGSTYDNRGNLAPQFFSKIVKRYEGTRLGRQELNAELLDDNPYALWQRDQIEKLRVDLAHVPNLVRIVIGVDPQVADPEASEEEQDLAETGIVAAGITGTSDPHLYILDDCSISGSPNEWAGAAVDAYLKYLADRIVAEVNNGGAMVEFTVRTVARDRGIGVSYSSVHASRGKYTRAEPVAALYEQGRVHHVGCFPKLEDQMVEWMPGMKSPDRMDALVWACSELGLAEASWATDPKLQEWMIGRAKS